MIICRFGWNHGWADEIYSETLKNDNVQGKPGRYRLAFFSDFMDY